MPTLSQTNEVVDIVLKIAGGLLAILLTVTAFLLRRHIKRWDDDIKKLDEKAEVLQKRIEEVAGLVTERFEECLSSITEGAVHDLHAEVESLKREWSDLRVHIPEHYLPRTDFVRDNTIIDGKVSALFRKFDRIEVALDFLKEQLDKLLARRSASNGQGTGDAA
jgi:predicted nuclease with TOPRIM domain